MNETQIIVQPKHICCHCSEAICYDGISSHMKGAYCLTGEGGHKPDECSIDIKRCEATFYIKSRSKIINHFCGNDL